MDCYSLIHKILDTVYLQTENVACTGSHQPTHLYCGVSSKQLQSNCSQMEEAETVALAAAQSLLSVIPSSHLNS